VITHRILAALFRRRPRLLPAIAVFETRSRKYQHSNSPICAVPLCCALLIGCTDASKQNPAAKVDLDIRRAPDGSILCTKTIEPLFQDQAGKVAETFSIPNPYTHAVFIDDVHTSCGCTLATVIEKTIAPGSHGFLKMTADLARRRGSAQFVCKLRASTGETWTCLLRSHLYPRLECNPPQFSFGVLEPRQGPELHGTISVYSQDDTPPVPTFAGPPRASALTVSLGNSTIELLAHGFAVRRVPLTLRRNPQTSVAYGPSSSMLNMSIVSGGQRFDLAIPVTCAVHSSFEIQPPRAFFGQVSQGTVPPHKQVVVRKLDNKPFHIKACTITNPAFRSTCESVDNGREWRVHILLDFIRLEQSQRFVFGELQLTTDVIDEPTTTIALAALMR
jgi:hypothetical protein